MVRSYYLPLRYLHISMSRSIESKIPISSLYNPPFICRGACAQSPNTSPIPFFLPSSFPNATSCWFIGQITFRKVAMKLLTFLVSLIAIAVFPPALGSALLEVRHDPIECVWPYGEYHEKSCLGNDWELTFPDYWWFEARLIDIFRWYHNYEKILCSPIDHYKICAFIQFSTTPVRGDHIKKLFEILAMKCEKSRCATIDVNVVEGYARDGVLKIDVIPDMGSCRRYCLPGEYVIISRLLPLDTRYW